MPVVCFHYKYPRLREKVPSSLPRFRRPIFFKQRLPTIHCLWQILLMLFSIHTRLVASLQILWSSQFTQTWLKCFRIRRHFDEGSCRYPRMLYHCVMNLIHNMHLQIIPQGPMSLDIIFQRCSNMLVICIIRDCITICSSLDTKKLTFGNFESNQHCFITNGNVLKCYLPCTSQLSNYISMRYPFSWAHNGFHDNISWELTMDQLSSLS